MSFSVVLPIHNEEMMLRYTLRSIYELKPTEAIFGLDRCSDGSENLIKAEAKKHPETKTRIKQYSEADGAGWRFRSAYLRRSLYAATTYDTILNTSADIRLCPTIKRHLPLIPNPYGLISFHYYEKPWNIQCFERALLGAIKPGFAGLLAFSKDAWRRTEDLRDLAKISRAEDTHLQLAIKTEFPVRHTHTRSLHLRPNETRQDHYNRGAATYQMLRIGSVGAFLRSLVMIRPAFFAGYRHAREMKL